VLLLVSLLSLLCVGVDVFVVVGGVVVVGVGVVVVVVVVVIGCLANWLLG